MTISVGTTSELKLRAVRTAFEALGIEANILSCATSSGVNEQPFGYEEIVRGASNRAREAAKANKTDLAVGIENGLVYIEEAQKFFDIPAVCIFSPDTGQLSLSFGTALPIPSSFVERVKDKNIDLGILIQSLNDGGEKDPVNYLLGGKLKREEVLTQAILSACGEVLFREKYES